VGTTRVLLLAGTTEAAELASALTGRPDVEVVASLAGHTRSPDRLPCPVRTGGFGGVDGLVRELRDGGYGALVDATHPFARVMPHHAAEAASAAGVARLRLLRPPWQAVDGDDWHDVPDLAAAAAALPGLEARRVLLTTGRLDLAPFAAVPPGTSWVVRSIERPDPLPLADATVVLARGPFSVDDELALLREHRIDTVVAKNSGGAAVAAKLTAARMLGVRVVMVRRPPGPSGPLATTPALALTWLDALAPGSSSLNPVQMPSDSDGIRTRFDPA
jgi:precorrin-6A/cobalt-precorrin-6A reductase